MKIVIPVAAFEPAGGFRVLSELATHWMRAGATVDFLADHRSKPPYFPTTAPVLWFDARGRIERQNDAAASFAAKGNAASIYLGMFRALRRIGPHYDVVLANHSLTAFPAALAGCGSARKWYYVQAYEPEVYGLERGWRNRLVQEVSALSYRLPLSQVANSPLYIGYRGIRARHWIAPGIDPEVFRLRSGGPTFGHDRPIVLGTIGRREATKGTRDALAAFEMLAARDPRMRLRVAYGNLPDDWSHPRCEVVRPSGDTELAGFYRSVDILLAPGLVQLGAFHYPVMEAMASGTPVVTTGYRPADPENAWIVPVRAPEAIAAAVREIIDTPPEQLAARLQAAEQAVRPYHWASVAADFLRLLAEPAAAVR